ncbi:MAG: rod shape-determining protein MreD [Pseudomonadota bacterium]
MTEASQTGLWLKRGAFVLLVLAIIFFHLLPLQTVPRRWAGPEWVTLFAFAWAVRRPDLVPTILLGLLLLLADLLLARPPGLWALLAFLAAERLKARALVLRDTTLVAEILEVSLLMVGISIAYQLTLAILLIDGINLWLTASQALTSVIAYPFVVFLTHVLMRVRKGTPGDLEATP